MKIAICAALAVAAAAAGCGKQSPSEGDSAVQAAASAPQPVPVAPAPPPHPPVAQGPWDGPLGVKMGLSADALRQSIQLKDSKDRFTYSATTAPNPHGAFDAYTFTAPPVAGLCQVTGIGKSVPTGVFGSELKSEYMALKAALTEKYGKPRSDFDFVRQGSLWTDPEDWMMGLAKKERRLAAFWNVEPTKKGEKRMELPNDLAGISIQAHAQDLASGFVAVRYGFSNEDACFEEIKKVENKPL